LNLAALLLLNFGCVTHLYVQNIGQQTAFNIPSDPSSVQECNARLLICRLDDCFIWQWILLAYDQIYKSSN